MNATTTILLMTAATVVTLIIAWLAAVAMSTLREWRAGEYMRGVAGFQCMADDGSQVWVAYHGHKAEALGAARDAMEDFGVRIVVK